MTRRKDRDRIFDTVDYVPDGKFRGSDSLGFANDLEAAKDFVKAVAEFYNRTPGKIHHRVMVVDRDTKEILFEAPAYSKHRFLHQNSNSNLSGKTGGTFVGNRRSALSGG